MLDFHKYLMRHGEGWILDIVEDAERVHGLHLTDRLTIEERWDFVMNDMPIHQPQRMAA